MIKPPLMSLSLIAVVGAFLCALDAALAHHSVGGTYDIAKVVGMSGTIAKVELINPHTRMELAAFDANGRETRWLIEMAGPRALVERGADPRALLEVGRRVNVEAYLAKDGSRNANAQFLITADGVRFDVADRWLEGMTETRAR